MTKITNNCVQFFCLPFADCPTSTMVPGKTLFTLPVALNHKSKQNNIVGLERYSANQNSDKSLGYVPAVQGNRFQN